MKGRGWVCKNAWGADPGLLQTCGEIFHLRTLFSLPQKISQNFSQKLHGGNR